MRLMLITVVALTLVAPATRAQNCQDGAPPTSDQRARRATALSVMRAINTAQSGFAARNGGRFGSLKELLDSGTLEPAVGKTPLNFTIDEPLLGWKFEFTSSPEGYAFLLKDRLDPCSFSFYSNQMGLIYQGRPIR